jgi:hypothetical protein
LLRDGKQCTRIAKRANSNSGGMASRANSAFDSRGPDAIKNAQALCCAAYYF